MKCHASALAHAFHCLEIRREHWCGCHGAWSCVVSGSGEFASAPQQKNHLIQVELELKPLGTKSQHVIVARQQYLEL